MNTLWKLAFLCAALGGCAEATLDLGSHPDAGTRADGDAMADTVTTPPDVPVGADAVDVPRSDAGCNAGATRACYTGAPSTAHVGRCHDGVQTCTSDGAWSADCVGEVLPATSETCANALDDTCDGRVDEACGGPATVALTTGGGHTCALRSTGEMDCWGNGIHGELGNAAMTQMVLRPTAVVGLGAVVDIAAAGYATCARRASGQVLCWGANGDGQLGDGTMTGRSMPGALVTGVTDAVEISGGQHTFCARRPSGSVVCWGFGGLGMLGDGMPHPYATSPTTVVGVTDAIALRVGSQSACVVRANGHLACWGDGGQGQLGDGVMHTSWVTTPQDAVGVTDAVDVTTGSDFGCAVRAGGGVVCWGNNDFGELGDGTTHARLAPGAVVGIADATHVVAGSECVCALRASGRVSCWGIASGGALGNGVTTNATVALPVDVMGLTDAVTLTGDDEEYCARRATGDVVCWGNNNEGQLGDGTTTSRGTPAPVLF